MQNIDFNNVIHINRLNDLLENKLDFDISATKYISIYLVVDNIKEGKTKSGKSYVDFVGKENDFLISCKVWNCTKSQFVYMRSDDKIKNGDIVKIVGTIEEYEDNYQLKVLKDKNELCIRKTDEKDNINFDYFFKKAPMSYEDMMSYINTIISSFKDNDFKNICNLYLKEYSDKLKYYPAGKANHHAYKLGLLYHSYNMLKQGEAVSSIYNLNRDLLLTGVLLHDCGKIVTMKSNEYGVVSDFNIEYVLFEHLLQGVLIIEDLGRKCEVPKDKILMLQHMIASHHGNPEWGAIVYPSFPEAEALHHIDNLDAKMLAMKEELDRMNDDEIMSNRIYSLNGRILYNYNLE